MAEKLKITLVKSPIGAVPKHKATCLLYTSGHKLGEFVATRTYRGHGKDEKKAGRK